MCKIKEYQLNKEESNQYIKNKIQNIKNNFLILE